MSTVQYATTGDVFLLLLSGFHEVCEDSTRSTPYHTVDIGLGYRLSLHGKSSHILTVKVMGLDIVDNQDSLETQSWLELDWTHKIEPTKNSHNSRYNVDHQEIRHRRHATAVAALCMFLWRTGIQWQRVAAAKSKAGPSHASFLEPPSRSIRHSVTDGNQFIYQCVAALCNWAWRWWWY
jgi:hypothetical protein